jgi:segregation and condensation protein B
MSQSSELPPDARRQEGISLDQLAQAFAQVMGAAPRPKADEKQSDELAPVGDEDVAVRTSIEEEQPSAADGVSDSTAADDACPVSPLSIFEAMLFVGNRDNRPLTAIKAAELMRDVSTDEIPALVEQLNRRYAADNCPYNIVGEGDGYRLTLRKAHSALRDKFYGRVHEARLSQAAIDILAIVAYRQPISGERISRLRGRPSGHILAQLVRRGLLRIERPEGRRRTNHYATTDRFLQLFNLQSLDDLPRSEDTPT